MKYFITIDELKNKSFSQLKSNTKNQFRELILKTFYQKRFFITFLTKMLK